MLRARTRLGALPLLALVLGSASCDASSDAGAAREASPQGSSAAALGTPPASPPVSPPVTNAGANAQAKEAWEGNVAWHTYDSGLEVAKRENKPIFLFVYADWCPKCRALRPFFAQADFETLAKSFVMVRQNADEEPEWLKPFNESFGTYVPRIFFLAPDGTVREDIKSPSPRYPYFYTTGQIPALMASMRLAANG